MPNGCRTRSAAVPLENLLVETDAPFLAPQGHRGRRCEPVYLRETIEFVAHLRGVDAAEIAAATTANAKKLYRLES